jgi:hypothetical protein
VTDSLLGIMSDSHGQKDIESSKYGVNIAVFLLADVNVLCYFKYWVGIGQLLESASKKSQKI